jgi:hypothetical protein
MHDLQKYKNVYDKHRNLKLAAAELNMKWQTLYWHLSRANHPVVGDKEAYGSPTDKMAKVLEDYFQELIPHAISYNESKFQAPMDFSVNGYRVDIKSSTKKDGYKSNPRKNPAFRWAFSTKVQENSSDFMIMFCMEGLDCGDHGDVEKILLVPKEFYHNKQSISVSCSKSKWYDFEVSEKELIEFFSAL